MYSHFLMKDYLPAQGPRFHMADLALDKGVSITPHDHDFYEFFVVLRGEFAEDANGRHNLVGRQQGRLLGPGDAHILTAAGRDNALRNIAFSPRVFRDALERTGLQDTPGAGRLQRYFTLDDAAFLVFQRKTELAYGPYPGGTPYDFLMTGVLDDLLLSLLTGPEGEGIPLWLSRARQAMEQPENFISGLPRLVELAGQTQEHLTRAFRRYYGATPTEYVNMLRLSHAARLLQTTALPVTEIIYACGFSNPSYFNRLFRQRYAMTPRDFRSNRNIFYQRSI